jgi:hypothetical protein
MRRQLHIWLSDDDCKYLETSAKQRDESVSAAVRRLIRMYRLRMVAAVPPGPTSPRSTVTASRATDNW